MKRRLLMLGICGVAAAYVVLTAMFYLLLKLVPTEFSIPILFSIIISGLFVAGLWYKGMKNIKKKKIVFLGCLLLLLLPVINTGAYIDNVRHSQYTALRWEQHPEDRAWMFSRLMKQDEFQGKSKAEIVELLGEPIIDQEKEEYVYWFADKRPQGQDTILYCFYHDNGWFPYEQITLFELDDKQQVINSYLAVIDH